MESQVTCSAHSCVQDDPLNLSPHDIPDTMKGSFYANPVLDEPDVSPQLREAHPEYYGKNICASSSNLPGSGYSSYIYAGPTDTAEVQDFEHAFKDLGRYVSTHCT